LTDDTKCKMNPRDKNPSFDVDNLTNKNKCQNCNSGYLSWVPEIDDKLNGYWFCNDCGIRNEHQWMVKDGKVIDNPKFTFGVLCKK